MVIASAKAARTARRARDFFGCHGQLQTGEGEGQFHCFVHLVLMSI
jgi:hypothetical protein